MLTYPGNFKELHVSYVYIYIFYVNSQVFDHGYISSIPI